MDTSVQRIGFVGTENSHTDHFIRLLNVEEHHPGYRAVALAGGQNERNQELAEKGDIDLIVDDVEELVDHVDAAVITTRDGAQHREQAEALLRAGLPLLVDKPFATTVEDARAIIAAAETAKVPLDSSSALRFVPEMADFTDARPKLGKLRRLTVAGPADPKSPYSGLFFYGIHHVEAALELLGNPPIESGPPVEIRRHDETVTARVGVGDVEVEFIFVAPGDGYRIPFHAYLAGTGDVIAKSLTLGSDYTAAMLSRFLTLWEEKTPIDEQRLLGPVALLQAITRAFETSA